VYRSKPVIIANVLCLIFRSTYSLHFNLSSCGKQRT
jgi:hypothetical protein